MNLYSKLLQSLNKVFPSYFKSSKSGINIYSETFFEQIRKSRLDDSEDFLFEIDLSDINIKVSPPLKEPNSDLNQLRNKLPPSFLNFIQRKANGLYIDIGNALTIYPVGKNIGTYWTDVLSLTETNISHPLFPSKDFIFFGMTGVDSEMFAFYTAYKFPDGEYPIVWFTPESVANDAFVFINTGFDRFLTIQYYLLKATEYGETGTYEEMKKTSSDKEKMRALANAEERFNNKLYSTFDPLIPKHNTDLYRSAMSYSEFKKAIEETLKSSSENINLNNE